MPDGVQVKQIKGLAGLIRRLKLMGKDVGPALMSASRKAILYVHQRMPEYPAPPENSSYRRTGTLGRTVTTMSGLHPNALSRVESQGGPLGSRIVAVIGTNLEYAPYVIDEENQAGIHAGRWWTLQGVVDNNLDGIKRIYESELTALVKGK